MTQEGEILPELKLLLILFATTPWAVFRNCSNYILDFDGQTCDDSNRISVLSAMAPIISLEGVEHGFGGCIRFLVI